MIFMPELEAPKPNFHFNVDAVEQHGHAVLDLSMQVSEQNARFNVALPQFEDPEIRDILHHELYGDQQQAVAERAARLAHIPSALIEKCLAGTISKLDERLTAFEATQTEISKVTSQLEAKRTQAIAAEILLGRNSEPISRAFEAFEAKITKRLRQLAERDGFEFGEFATLAVKIARLQGLYLPTNPTDAPTEPRIPEPTRTPAVLRQKEQPEPKTAEKPARTAPIEAARRISFSLEIGHDTTPAEVSTAVPPVIFAEPDEAKAISSKETLRPKGTTPEHIARTLRNNPDAWFTTATLAKEIYGETAEITDNTGRIKSRLIATTIGRQLHVVRRLLGDDYKLELSKEPVYPNAPLKPGRQKLMRQIIRVTTATEINQKDI